MRNYNLKNDSTFIYLIFLTLLPNSFHTIKIRTRIGTWFRLFYRTVLWEDSDDFPTVDHFIDYVISNHEVYGLCDCSGFEKCIVGQVCGNIEDGEMAKNTQFISIIILKTPFSYLLILLLSTKSTLFHDSTQSNTR